MNLQAIYLFRFSLALTSANFFLESPDFLKYCETSFELFIYRAKANTLVFSNLSKSNIFFQKSLKDTSIRLCYTLSGHS